MLRRILVFTSLLPPLEAGVIDIFKVLLILFILLLTLKMFLTTKWQKKRMSKSQNLPPLEVGVVDILISQGVGQGVNIEFPNLQS